MTTAHHVDSELEDLMGPAVFKRDRDVAEKRASQMENSMMSEYKELFNTLDATHSGRVSRHDLAEGLGMTLAQCSELLAQGGIGPDHRLDLIEFINLMADTDVPADEPQHEPVIPPLGNLPVLTEEIHSPINHGPTSCSPGSGRRAVPMAIFAADLEVDCDTAPQKCLSEGPGSPPPPPSPPHPPHQTIMSKRDVKRTKRSMLWGRRPFSFPRRHRNRGKAFFAPDPVPAPKASRPISLPQSMAYRAPPAPRPHSLAPPRPADAHAIPMLRCGEGAATQVPLAVLEELISIFYSLDVNQDGEISVADLTEGLGLDRTEAESLIRAGDSAGKGTLQLAEFLEAMAQAELSPHNNDEREWRSQSGRLTLLVEGASFKKAPCGAAGGDLVCEVA